MSAPRVVVIDTDPGIDDAFALALALRSPELQVPLITTVAGNAALTRTTENAALLLDLLEAPPDLVLARGAVRPLQRSVVDAAGFHGEDGLGECAAMLGAAGCGHWPVRADAVDRLLRAARSHAGALTIVALGPLTNLARALRRDPAALAGVGRIIAMGGAVRVPGNVTPVAEFNAFADPHAAAEVLGAGLALTLVPLDVTQQVRLDEAWLRDGLGGRRDLLARTLRQMTRLVLRRHRHAAMALHDPLAVALALDADLVRCERLRLQVVTEGELTAGMTVEDRRRSAAPRRSGGAAVLVPGEVEVALQVDAPAVLSLFAERVLMTPRRAAARRAPRVAVLGSVNVDLAVYATDLPRPGQTVMGTDLVRSAGGKGANQAVAARRAGAQVSLIGRVGDDDLGRHSRLALAALGIDVRALALDSCPTGVALISVDQHGQNQIAVAPGANRSLTPARLGPHRAVLISARVLLTQLETPLETVMLALRDAHEAGVMTILNPAPVAVLPAAVARWVDVLVANELEAEALLGQPVNTVPEVRRALDTLRLQGFAAVVITLGRRGVMWHAEGRFGRLRAVPVTSLDSTGAGDTFVGYLAAALAEGASFASALSLANRAAALSVTRRGAQDAIPRRAELELEPP